MDLLHRRWSSGDLVVAGLHQPHGLGTPYPLAATLLLQPRASDCLQHLACHLRITGTEKFPWADANQPEHAQQPEARSGHPTDAPPQPKPSTAGQGNRPDSDDDQPHRTSGAGRIVLGLVVLLAAIITLIAVTRAVANPRTDDAEVLANYIGMAPQVEGPILQLPIHDNQLVKAGDLLFAIDDRPYRYALERAQSEQAALEGQIEDRQRAINSQISGIHVARANVASSASNQDAMNAGIAEAQANLEDARAALRRTEADRQYAEDNLHRLEPLLKQQFVTIDQVEQARTLLETRTPALSNRRRRRLPSTRPMSSPTAPTTSRPGPKWNSVARRPTRPLMRSRH